MLRCKWQGCSKQLPTVEMFNLHIADHMVREVEVASSTAVEEIQAATNPSVKRCDSTTPVPLFSCDFRGCGKQYATQRGLMCHSKAHERAAQRGAEAELFTCDVDGCGKQFESKETLSSHMSKHLNGFICEVETCGKQYENKKTLSNHMFKHLNGLICEVEGCGKHFRNKKIFSNHMLKHLYGISCEVEGCGKHFKSKKTLSNHMLTHLYGFVCEVEGCGRQLCSRHSLLRHARTHRNLSKPLDGSNHHTDSALPRHQTNERAKEGEEREESVSPERRELLDGDCAWKEGNSSEINQTSAAKAPSKSRRGRPKGKKPGLDAGEENKESVSPEQKELLDGDSAWKEGNSLEIDRASSVEAPPKSRRGRPKGNGKKPHLDVGQAGTSAGGAGDGKKRRRKKDNQLLACPIVWANEMDRSVLLRDLDQVKPLEDVVLGCESAGVDSGFTATNRVPREVKKWGCRKKIPYGVAGDQAEEITLTKTFKKKRERSKKKPAEPVADVDQGHRINGAVELHDSLVTTDVNDMTVDLNEAPVRVCPWIPGVGNVETKKRSTGQSKSRDKAGLTVVANKDSLKSNNAAETEDACADREPTVSVSKKGKKRGRPKKTSANIVREQDGPLLVDSRITVEPHVPEPNESQNDALNDSPLNSNDIFVIEDESAGVQAPDIYSNSDRYVQELAEQVHLDDIESNQWESLKSVSTVDSDVARKGHGWPQENRDVAKALCNASLPSKLESSDEHRCQEQTLSLIDGTAEENTWKEVEQTALLELELEPYLVVDHKTAEDLSPLVSLDTSLNECMALPVNGVSSLEGGVGEKPEDLDALLGTIWRRYLPVESDDACVHDDSTVRADDLAPCEHTADRGHVQRVGQAEEETREQRSEADSNGSAECSTATSEPPRNDGGTIAEHDEVGPTVTRKPYKARPKSRQKKAAYESDDSLAITCASYGASSEVARNMKHDESTPTVTRKPYKARPKSRQKNSVDESDGSVALPCASYGAYPEQPWNNPTEQNKVVPMVKSKPYKPRPKSRQKKSADECDRSVSLLSASSVGELPGNAERSGEQDENNGGTMLLPPNVQYPYGGGLGGEPYKRPEPEVLEARRLYCRTKQLQAIVGISKMNPLTFRVKWSGLHRLEDILSAQLRLAYPHHLIAWYNARMTLKDFDSEKKSCHSSLRLMTPDEVTRSMAV